MHAEFCDTYSPKSENFSMGHSFNRTMLVEVILDNVYSQEELKSSIEKVKEIQNSVEDIQITLKINMG